MEIMHALPMEGNSMLEVMQIIGWDKMYQFGKNGEEGTSGTVTNVKEVVFGWVILIFS